MKKTAAVAATALLVTVGGLLTASPASAQQCVRLHREYVTAAECNNRNGQTITYQSGDVVTVSCNYDSSYYAWVTGTAYSLS